jgi:hypothetical protein
MTEDIVTRLRQKYSGQLPICSEAADEIERLRREVNLLLGACERFAESDPRYEAFSFYFRKVRP